MKEKDLVIKLDLLGFLDLQITLIPIKTLATKAVLKANLNKIVKF